jgi:hypothetical protein
MVAKPTRSPATEPPPPPEIRSLVGYAALVIGAVLLFLGWYGVSGSANVAEQVPYLASASIPGAALIIAGAVLMASDQTRRSNERAAQMVEALYRLLTEAVNDDDDRSQVDRLHTRSAAPASETLDPGGGATLVQVGGGNRFHRPECALVDGKADLETVGERDIAERRLSACPICDPPSPAT